MRKIMSLMLGLSLILGTASVFAQEKTDTKTTKTSKPKVSKAKKSKKTDTTSTEKKS
jgi:hypothetical protein